MNVAELLAWANTKLMISWSAALILRYCASRSERHGLASAISVHPALLWCPPRNGGDHHNDRSQQGHVVHAAQRIIQPRNHNWTSAGVCRLRLWWDLYWFPPALLGGYGLRSRQQAEHGVAVPTAFLKRTLISVKPKKINISSHAFRDSFFLQCDELPRRVQVLLPMSDNLALTKKTKQMIMMMMIMIIVRLFFWDLNVFFTTINKSLWIQRMF